MHVGSSLDILRHAGTNGLTFPVPRPAVPLARMFSGETGTRSCRGAAVLPGAVGSRVSYGRQEDRCPGEKHSGIGCSKHVFKAPVDNVCLCIIFFFKK